MNVGKSIKVACAIKEMTQKDLSESSGVSEGTISKLAKNHIQCKQGTLESLSKALDMPVSEFISLGE